MKPADFQKGECTRCHGHLEFPADAVGHQILCPHCGQTTVLTAAGSAPATLARRRLAAMIALTGGLVAVFAALLANRAHLRPAPPAPPVPPRTPAPENGPRPGEWVTNDFAISGGALEKTPGSSLVYVVGHVRNLSTRQRFGVKVDYTLVDSAGRSFGHATDYHSVLDANADWKFKAMVMDAKAASAGLFRISEDQ